MFSSDQLPADEFVRRFRPELVPFHSKIQWFSVVNVGADEIATMVEEPLSSLPPRLVESLPRLNLFLVPYLKGGGKAMDQVVFETPEPAQRSDSFQMVGPEDANLLLPVQEVSENEIHYNLFGSIASLAWEVATPDIRDRWQRELKDELRREVHGEIDEESWQKKNALLARQSAPIRDSKLFRDYARASFVDTLTLYLHGLCCDIDVEPSPRQSPSSEIRRRLELLRGLYPPPDGYCLFPEERDKPREARESRRRARPSDAGKSQQPSGKSVFPRPAADSNGTAEDTPGQDG
ncbi:MAG: hypothetical protein MUF01_10435 [Bryobacterales bacterium]|jgi:hypothetical protein|nr:hypothetical protein [Bryobacterales bacterium]